MRNAHLIELGCVQEQQTVENNKKLKRSCPLKTKIPLQNVLLHCVAYDIEVTTSDDSVRN